MSVGRLHQWVVATFLVVAGLNKVQAQSGSGTHVVKAIPVDRVWAGHPVGFDLHTTDTHQYVCYYDTDRNMVIAQRSLNSDAWQKTTLPTQLGWDSHNYVTMAIDREGYIHVSGNMHNVPMIYFRSVRPHSIATFDKLPMTGQNEDRATYPVFFKDKVGDLYFQYRNGGSGDGITYWNKYNTNTKKWQGLFETPFFDGEKESNAYMANPKLGPDGYFYMVWMWRMTPVANTNHNLSCIRSQDLVQWENLAGQPMALPVKWRDTQAVVDPVAPWNGLINMSFQISWDSQQVPYISYHKFDKQGVSQVFISRWEKQGGVGAWQTYQISSWKDFQWDLNRSGSLQNSVGISGVSQAGEGQLAVQYFHEKEGAGTWVLDHKTLKVMSTLSDGEDTQALRLPGKASGPGMTERRKTDNTGRYVMQWFTLPTNQDKPRSAPYPAPAQMVLYDLGEQ